MNRDKLELKGSIINCNINNGSLARPNRVALQQDSPTGHRRAGHSSRGVSTAPSEPGTLLRS